MTKLSKEAIAELNRYIARHAMAPENEKKAMKQYALSFFDGILNEN